ncbi:glycosyltransferase family 4 protein [Endozoicomonas sp. GU-1]|uniref:glycosyltransferase family 4 protein n=1 Tax=Endozoicomonas sp. GU-1 TaxID=3009078 RepID=UPI0022B323D9|nr:glycosyltransferase family 4 protein [Endozoicomonas sp. GU-1]WBA79643.1 glycosyltransferase family 4 protein [Endozoicomonas sp. GU-1]WBA87225.1 glycosyltransferase family 4 protein [Endozoicomonas sp. GU-1]
MRIALLPDDYLPESTRSHAKMLHDLAVEFVNRGHKVVVITPGVWHQPKPVMMDHIDGVEVWRFRSKPTRGLGNVQRAINETLLSFRAYQAIKHLVRLEPFDLCVNYSPTIFFGPLAYFLKAHGAYIYLVLRDFFPQWIIDEGMISEHSLASRYLRFFEHFNYRVSDCIAVQSPANVNVFTKMYPKPVNLTVLMNWTVAKPVTYSESARLFLTELGIDEKVIFFYGGNIGHAQDMANLMRLAKGLWNHQHVHFLLVGQGDEYELVTQLKIDWNLENVTLIPSVSQDEYQQILSAVDVGLFSLSNKHSAHNFPGKLLGYMVQSLPILGSINAGNDVIDFIHDSGSGFVTVNGDDKAFLENALLLANDPALRERAGINACKLLMDSFSVTSAADKIIEQLSA